MNTKTRAVAAAALLVLVAGCQSAPGASSPGAGVPGSVASPSVSGVQAPGATTGTPGATASDGTGAGAGTGATDGTELRRLEVPSVGFSEPVSPMTSVQMGNAIDPPLAAPGKPSVPVRVSDKGVPPTASAADTVYVGCHTSAKHGADAYPCNVLIRKVAKGATIIATTDAGTLTYTVTETRSIPKDQFADDEQTWAEEPKRLVFVVCDIVDGVGNGANWVIYATLP